MVAEARPVAAARAPAGSPLRTATALAWIGAGGGAPRELPVASAQTEAEVEQAEARTGSGRARVSGPHHPRLSPEVRWAILPDAGFALATALTGVGGRGAGLGNDEGRVRAATCCARPASIPSPPHPEAAPDV